MLFGDRVKETTTTTGSGDIALLGAATGCRTFNAAFGTGVSNPFTYAIIAVDGSNNPTGDWEVGEAYLSASTTLARPAACLMNSNGNTTPLTLNTGTKLVIADLPADYVQRVIRRLYAPSASGSNGADLTEDVLQTYSLAANKLHSNGQSLRIVAWGTLGATTNSKTVKLYFGSTVIATFNTTNSAITAWRTEATVMRTGSGAQTAHSITFLGTAGTSWSMSNTTPAETDTAAITIKVTGQNSTSSVAGSVTCTSMRIEMIN